jgi:hypothetical protein
VGFFTIENDLKYGRLGKALDYSCRCAQFEDGNVLFGCYRLTLSATTAQHGDRFPLCFLANKTPSFIYSIVSTARGTLEKHDEKIILYMN